MAYNRIFKLAVTPVDLYGNIRGSSIVITSPLTIKFNVQRMPFAGRCTASIDIYNLNQDTRSKLFLDWYDFKNIRQVTLEAGYENGKFDRIYKGRIRICTTKKAYTDNVTHIEAISGLGVLDSMLHTSLNEGESLVDTAGMIIGEMPGVQPGAVSLPDFSFKRPVALIGNAVSVLKTYTKDNVAIDLDKVIVIDEDEVIDGDVRVIDDESGLLGTPERQQTSLVVNCVFEPRIKVGQALEIRSSVAPEFDGQYKVWGVTHNGIIGATQGGQCVTTITLWTGLNLFGRFKTSWIDLKSGKYGSLEG